MSNLPGKFQVVGGRPELSLRLRVYHTMLAPTEYELIEAEKRIERLADLMEFLLAGFRRREVEITREFPEFEDFEALIKQVQEDLAFYVALVRKHHIR